MPTKETTRTLGPWTAKQSIRLNGIEQSRDWGIFDAKNQIIAEVFQIVGKDEAGYIHVPVEAHAALLAEAPDMFRLLDDLETEMDGRYDGAEDSGTRWMGEYMERLKNVLNRARGGVR